MYFLDNQILHENVSDPYIFCLLDFVLFFSYSVKMYWYSKKKKTKKSPPSFQVPSPSTLITFFRQHYTCRVFRLGSWCGNPCPIIYARIYLLNTWFLIFFLSVSADSHNNTTCERCVEGKTFSNVSSKSEPCLNCSRCMPGFVEESACTLEVDTVCRSENPGLLLKKYFTPMLYTEGLVQKLLLLLLCK